MAGLISGVVVGRT